MEEYGCRDCTNPTEDCSTCPRNEQRKIEWYQERDKEKIANLCCHHGVVAM